MTKKRYYEEMEKYAKLAEEYQHNAQYVNEEDFTNIRNQLNRELEHFFYMASHEYAAYGHKHLLKYRDRLLHIQSKIQNIECLSPDEYADTYYEEHYFIFFTKKQIFFVLTVGITLGFILELVY